MSARRRLPPGSRAVVALAATLAVAVTALGTAGCAVNPVSGDQELVLMSEDQELALGRELHPKVLKAYGRYDDPELQAYVQDLGASLAATSHRPGLIYRFTVLDSDQVNAFALPGGYIYITRGLLAYLNSEDELAAVLGHEVGHVTARHGVRQYTARQAAGIGYTIGAVLVPELRGRGAQDLFNLVGTAAIRGYGREHELEADRLGAEYLARTRRDPRAMLRVIGVLKDHEQFATRKALAEDREPMTYHGLFATHPDNDTRLQEVVASAGPGRGASEDAAARLRFLERLRGLAFGPAEKEGVVRGNAFYHRELGFALDFPPGWRVTNRSDRLLARSPDNDALLQLTTRELNRRTTPRAFLVDLLEVRSLLRADDLDVNGLSAHTGFATTGTPWGERLARHTAIFYADRAYVLTSAVKDAANPRLYNTAILNAAFSFRPLTGAERALAAPLRLDLMSAAEGLRIQDLAAASRIPAYPAEQLRLLNGLFPDGEPQPGQTIKVVR